MKIRLTILISLIAFQFSLAQESGNWWMYFGDANVSDRIHLHHEIQYRNYNFIGNLEQLLIRGRVGYDLSPNNHNLLLSYDLIQSKIEGENNGLAPAVYTPWARVRARGCFFDVAGTICPWVLRRVMRSALANSRCN